MFLNNPIPLVAPSPIPKLNKLSVPAPRLAVPSFNKEPVPDGAPIELPPAVPPILVPPSLALLA